MTGKCCYCAWWGTLLLKMFSDAITVNVALRQSGKFCEKTDVSEKVFDGDTNYMNSVFMDAGACSKAYLEVRLEKARSIQFVVVYHGEGHANQLDFFNVDLLNDKLVRISCGYYSQKAEVLGLGMRVNCQDKNKLYNLIKVITRKSGSYDIAELEAHTFALESETYVMLHQGCYAEFKGSTVEISLEKCQKKCFEENKMFVAIKANRICSCGNDLEEKTILDNRDCTIKCPGQERYCGGENAFSVYMIKVPLPTVWSCHPTTNSDSSSSKKMNLTIEKCLQECKKYMFFATLLGDRCLCLDSTPSFVVIDFEIGCTTQCSGDKTRLCGGETGMTVMRTCKRKDSKMACEDILRCNGEYDMFGVCISGCKSGYVGKHCLQKAAPDIVKVPDLRLTTTTNRPLAATARDDDTNRIDLGLTTTTNLPLVATARDDDTNGTDDINKSKDFMETLKLILLIVIVTSSAICCYGMTRKHAKPVHSEGSQASAGASQVPPGETSQVPPGETSQVQSAEP